mmetsp:Transcript_4341/g.7587  ORF Transcript_4341/g.7587 Transcript_4341/m.7587 type:complete len:195 (-) Transcript_4341:54-638(-)
MPVRMRAQRSKRARVERTQTSNRVEAIGASGASVVVPTAADKSTSRNHMKTASSTTGTSGANVLTTQRGPISVADAGGTATFVVIAEVVVMAADAVADEDRILAEVAEDTVPIRLLNLNRITSSTGQARRQTTEFPHHIWGGCTLMRLRTTILTVLALATRSARLMSTIAGTASGERTLRIPLANRWIQEQKIG